MINYMTCVGMANIASTVSSSLSSLRVMERVSDRPQIYIGRDVPGQLFSAFFGAGMAYRFRNYPYRFGILSACFYPLGIALEMYATSDTFSEKKMYYLLGVSSMCKNIAFVGPASAHMSSLVRLQSMGHQASVLGSNSSAITSIGATIGIMTGLTYSYHVGDYKLALPFSFLYPLLLSRAWYRLL